MQWPQISKFLFIYKFHYFFFQAGIAPCQTAMPVYAQTLGFSSFIVGTIYAILPIASLVVKPALGALADAFKWHKAVMLGTEFIILASYFCVQFLPSDFTPPIQNASKALDMFCQNDNAMFICGDTDYNNQTYIMLDAPGYKQNNTSCKFYCQLQSDTWAAMCQLTEMNEICRKRFQIKGENCHRLPKQKNENVCQAVGNFSPVCKISCHGKNPWTRGSDADDDEELYQDDAVTFGQYQFYVFVILLIGGMAGTAVTTTLSDTICIVQTGDPHLYGRQRLWGSIGYGVLSVISGLITDNLTEPGEPKNYLPAFYLTLGVLLLDIVVTQFYMEVNISTQSESIAKDVGKLLLNFRIWVFLVWCTAMGVSLGLTWTFLYWLLEDLAKDQGPDTVANIKTIEGLTNGVQTFLGETPAFFFAGWVIKRLGHGHTMSVILFFIGLRFTCYSFLYNPWFVLFIEPLQLYYGLFYPTMTSYADMVAPPGTEATVQSLMCAVCEGIGVAIGAFLGGYFYDEYGGHMCFRIFGISFFIMFVINEVIEFIYRIQDKKVTSIQNNQPQVAA